MFRFAPVPIVALVGFVLSTAAGLPAAELVVELPEKVAVKSATAVAAGVKVETAGKVDGPKISFANLLPDTPYELRITLADGVTLQGVDLGWYNEEPPAKEAGPLTADDREQTRALVQDIKDFYNKKEIVALRGDHDRAVGLVRLVRDTDFYAGKGQIIWRIELWYFKNQAGGWEIVGQQNKILRRERFKDAAAFKAGTESLRFIPALGGIRVGKDKPETVKVLADDLKGS